MDLAMAIVTKDNTLAQLSPEQGRAVLKLTDGQGSLLILHVVEA
jgi:hypothetical protein